MTDKAMDEQVLRIWHEVTKGVHRALEEMHSSAVKRPDLADFINDAGHAIPVEFARRLRAEWMAQQEPVALCLRANSDGSYGEPVVFTRYAMFAENLAKAQKHQWIIHGAGELVPLYAAPVAKPAAQDCVSVPIPDHIRGYNLLYQAAIEFVDKVERGEARSKRSYQSFKEALSLLAAPKEPKT